MKTSLTLLAQDNLPLKFWDHAFFTSTYLINMLTSISQNHKSPFFTIHLQCLDYKFLKTFGCACFPFLRPCNAHKLDMHSKECMFFGYSYTHRWYKCLDHSDMIFISKDFIFNEIRFPYTELLSLSSHSTSGPSGHVYSNTDIQTFLRDTPTPIVHIPNTPTFPIPTSLVSLTTSDTESQSQSHHASTSMNEPHSNPITEYIHTFFSSASSSPYPHLITTYSTRQTQIQVANSDHSVVSISLDVFISPSSSYVSPILALLLSPIINPHNIHPMQTRAKNWHSSTRLQPTLLLTHVEPTSYRQALAIPECFANMQT